MKNWIKENVIALIVIICITGYVGYTTYRYHRYDLSQRQFFVERLEDCQQEDSKCTEDTYRFIEKNIHTARPDTLSAYFEIQYRMDYIALLLMVSMITVGCYHFSRKYKTGFFKYELQRMNYSTYLKQTLIDSHKNLWIILYYIGITFLFAFLFSGHFNVSQTIQSGNNIGLVSTFYRQLPLFLIIYLLNLLLNGIFYINLGILLTKKSYNYLVNVIAAILCFFGLMIFCLYGISGTLFSSILDISGTFNQFDLLNFWTYLGKNPFLTTILNSLFLSIGSTILVGLVYRKREGLILESEGK